MQPTMQPSIQPTVRTATPRTRQPIMQRAIEACVFLSVLLSSVAVAIAQNAKPPEIKLPSDPPYYRVHYAAGTQPGELVYGVSYILWLPENVKEVRGIIVHQHGCGEGACRGGATAAYDLHWQALARKHQCALLGPSYEQPEGADCQMWCDARNGSDKRFRQALDDLSAATGHAELKTVPWALWGHSGGGTWAGTMLMLHPDRIAAAWLRSGAPKFTPREGSTLPALEVPEAAYQVPVMCNLGTQEGVTVKEGRFAKVWEGVEAFFSKLREPGGLVAVSVDPASSHDCGNQRYLAIPWFDACLSARLSSTGALKRCRLPMHGWLRYSALRLYRLMNSKAI